MGRGGAERERASLVSINFQLRWAKIQSMASALTGVIREDATAVFPVNVPYEGWSCEG